jgi:hypothetical protein
VISFTPRLLYPPWLGEPQSRSGRCGIEKNVCPCYESNPSCEPIFHRYTELSRLPGLNKGKPFIRQQRHHSFALWIKRMGRATRKQIGQEVQPPTCFREVFGSNFGGPHAGYPGIFQWFISVHPPKCFDIIGLDNDLFLPNSFNSTLTLSSELRCLHTSLKRPPKKAILINLYSSLLCCYAPFDYNEEKIGVTR